MRTDRARANTKHNVLDWPPHRDFHLSLLNGGDEGMTEKPPGADVPVEPEQEATPAEQPEAPAGA